jgi:site-specific DNA recombinase
MGLLVTQVRLDDAISGTNAPKDRPGLSMAILDWRSSPTDTVILVHSLSRLARRQKVLWGLLDDRDGLGLPVMSATEPFETSTPMGRAMLGMLGVWAALESDLASDRTIAALAAAKERGTTSGAPSSAQLLPASTVERVEELRAQGLSYARIADALNTDNVPGPTGGNMASKRCALHLSSSGLGP